MVWFVRIPQNDIVVSEKFYHYECTVYKLMARPLVSGALSATHVFNHERKKIAAHSISGLAQKERKNSAFEKSSIDIDSKCNFSYYLVH